MADIIDNQILQLLTENARITVKEIAERVNLTAPAVSERMRKMEREGTIGGYTVVLGPAKTKHLVSALISVSAAPQDKEAFLQIVQEEEAVQQCYFVTGSYSFIVIVTCEDMPALESLINRFQKIGQTNTQIILSTPIKHRIIV
ncbi:MAG: Lrp/AsnC family transcriptional regulator [Oscillospiraceae bacterium]|nr:Lrp/AsnC family transcriptional regulator [Oscillospiraceae bacterium]